jgi:DedD protein
MAFFKFPWPSQKSQDETPVRRSRAPQAESIDVMRRRARHRLIGAAVLVLVGVLGFPLLFDTQPRPIPVNIPIDIPDQNKVAPLVVPAPVAGLDDGEEVVASARTTASASKPTTPAVPIPVPVPAAVPVVKPEPKPEPKPPVAKPEPKPELKPVVAKPEPKPEPKPVVPAPKPRPEPAPAPQRTDDAIRARALLEGRSTETARAEDGRFIVQVGAFADVDKAREVRSKLERSGLKTYAQVVETKDGKRTRVRVGPFASRADADKAAARIKGLDLPASVLTL